ncbi:DUF1761 domain-containing protein [Candidatus Parcubacteria bacterium]|nr:DUF1761 domain-containing protein [Candidatus Parcubacteria bacterium]
MLSILAHADTALYGTFSVPEVHINWLAIIGAAAAAMVIGFLWYGPLFGQQWMKLVKLTKKDTEKAWKKPTAVMAAMVFLQALIVKHFVVYVAYFYQDLGSLWVGVLTGFWLFVGIALPLVLSSNMFAGRHINLSYIEAGNQLVTLVTVGAILAVWI